MQMTEFAVSHPGAIPENLFQTQPDSYSKSRIVLLLVCFRSRVRVYVGECVPYHTDTRMAICAMQQNLQILKAEQCMIFIFGAKFIFIWFASFCLQ